MTSGLLQPHGDKLRPVAYFSSKLDAAAAGLPRRLRAVAAAEKALLASKDIVGYAPLALLVSHAVTMILSEQKTSHLSAAGHLRYRTCLLDTPNVSVKRCNLSLLLSRSVSGLPQVVRLLILSGLVLTLTHVCLVTFSLSLLSWHMVRTMCQKGGCVYR